MIGAAVSIVWAVASGVATVSGADARQIDEHALARVKSIHQCEVAITSVFWSRDDRSNGPRQRRFVIFLDGQKHRTDVLEPPPKGMVIPAGEKYFRQVYCLADGIYSHWENRLSPRGARLFVQTRATSATTTLLVDPRLIGLVAESTLGLPGQRSDAVLGYAKRTEETIESQSLGEVQCWMVQFRSSDSAVHRYWVAPAMNYAVVRMEKELAAADGKTYFDRVRCELVQHQPSGVWFPSSYGYERLIDLKPVARERATVAVGSINRELSPALFTIAGMNVPADTPVGLAGGGGGVWNGTEIVGESLPSAPLDVATTRAVRGRKTQLYSTTALITALLSMLFFWRFLKG